MNAFITIFILLIIAFLLGYLLRSLVCLLTKQKCGKFSWLMLVLLIVWSIISIWWYVCKIKNQCAAAPETVQISQPLQPKSITENAVEPVTAIVSSSWPLYFNWNSATPQLADNFDSYKQQLLQEIPAGGNLKITGLYSAGEKNSTDFSDLGLARAYNVRELLVNSLSEENIDLDRIKLTSEEFTHPDWKVNQPFDLVRFTHLTVTQTVPSATESKRLDFQQSFYFDTNSTHSDTQIDLTSAMIEQINLLQQQIEVVGHTDDVGSQAHNQKLALLRADAIKTRLIEKGISENLISVSSKGECQPTATNETSSGRKENRRVELIIK